MATKPPTRYNPIWLAGNITASWLLMAISQQWMDMMVSPIAGFPKNSPKIGAQRGLSSWKALVETTCGFSNKGVPLSHPMLWWSPTARNHVNKNPPGPVFSCRLMFVFIEPKNSQYVFVSGLCCIYIWHPGMGVPQNRWFIRENRTKIGWFGGTPMT